MACSRVNFYLLHYRSIFRVIHSVVKELTIYAKGENLNNVEQELVSRLRPGRFGVQIPANARGFPHLQNVQTGPGIYQTFCLVGLVGRGTTFNTRLYVVPKLGMSRAYTRTSTPTIRTYDLDRKKFILSSNIFCSTFIYVQLWSI